MTEAERIRQFTQLYQQYAPGILKLCLGYAGEESLAQDLLQESFVSVWNHLDQFRGEAQWSTWIYRVAVNTCLSYLRKKKLPTVSAENIPLVQLPDESSGKEQQVQQLYKCINRLAEADRLIIALVLEEKPYVEIAAITGLTENNLRVKIHRIKKQLTEIYQQYGSI